MEFRIGKPCQNGSGGVCNITESMRPELPVDAQAECIDAVVGGERDNGCIKGGKPKVYLARRELISDIMYL
ncbi:MAG: hypothetical protein ABII01_05220 [Candidatus Woesearchaeota archaeon]